MVFGWWTAFCVVFEVSGAVADAEFACLSSISLADTDFFVKFFEESLLFQHIECRNEIAITCAAGINFFYRICHFYHFSSLWNVLLNVFSQYTNICFSNIRNNLRQAHRQVLHMEHQILCNGVADRHTHLPAPGPWQSRYGSSPPDFHHPQNPGHHKYCQLQ